MSIGKTIKNLCTPSYLYFVISMISIVILAFQNIGNSNTYCVGVYQCHANTLGVFLGKILYILFWTWVLNTLCKAGYEKISWFVFLLPFIFMFIAIAGLLILRAGNINK